MSHWRISKPFVESMDKTVTPFKATWIFDQLAIIGDKNLACFLYDTSDGYVLLDCMDTDERSIDILENSFIDLNINPAEIKEILITHGHRDHYGTAKYIHEKYGSAVKMSKGDYQLAITPKGPVDFSLKLTLDSFIEDEDIIEYDGGQIRIVSTPGHTPSCLSFIVKVTDEGRPHYICLWGGTGIYPSTDIDKYLESIEKLRAICNSMNVDGEISNHPYTDNTDQRLNVLQNITDGVPNPFIIGNAAFNRYMDMFKDYAHRKLIERNGMTGM